MLLDIIIIFCIDLWGFSIGPPYFGYNSTGHENHILCILMFYEHSQTKFDSGFFGINILS
jgi:hypothetical protein